MSKRLLIFCLILTAAGLTAQQATLVYLEESVVVVRDGREISADFGTPLVTGDLIRTGPAATAIIRTETGSEIKLQEQTELKLRNLGPAAEVHLDRGGIFSRVRRLAGRSYTVSTPSVAAGVRGTEFFIAYGRTVEQEPDVWLCVNEGSVAVSVDSGQEVVVNEGEGVNILGSSRITDPRFFPWTQELNWNMDPSAGEVRDATNLDGAYSDLLDVDYD